VKPACDGQLIDQGARRDRAAQTTALKDVGETLLLGPRPTTAAGRASARGVAFPRPRSASTGSRFKVAGTNDHGPLSCATDSSHRDRDEFGTGRGRVMRPTQLVNTGCHRTEPCSSQVGWGRGGRIRLLSKHHEYNVTSTRPGKSRRTRSLAAALGCSFYQGVRNSKKTGGSSAGPVWRRFERKKPTPSRSVG